MRTNIVIDDDLMKEAMALSKLNTKKAKNIIKSRHTIKAPAFCIWCNGMLDRRVVAIG